MWHLRFRIWGLGVEVRGLRLRVSDMGSEVWGLSCGIRSLGSRVQGLRFEVWGSGFWVHRPFPSFPAPSHPAAPVLGFRIEGLGLGFRVWG